MSAFRLRGVKSVQGLLVFGLILGSLAACAPTTSGTAVPATDAERASMKCQTQQATVCALTISNDPHSQHSLHWAITNVAPQAASIMPSSLGTLQPGGSANVTITLAQKHNCPVSVSLEDDRPNAADAGPPATSVLTYPCT